jgi:predicted ABC-type ATPase
MPEGFAPIMILIGGPIGSGKSFTYREIRRRIGAHDYINSDKIASDLFPGMEIHRKEREIAKAETRRRMIEAISQRKSLVVLESPFSDPEKILFMQQARDAGYITRFYFVSTNDVSINIRRNEDRKKIELRGPSDDMVRDSYTDTLLSYPVNASIAHQSFVFDNSVDFKDPLAVFQTQDGNVERLFSEPLPWAERLIERLGPHKALIVNPLKQTEDVFSLTEDFIGISPSPTPMQVSNMLGTYQARTLVLAFLRRTVREMERRGRTEVDFR